jgi:hypothetical protein
MIPDALSRKSAALPAAGATASTASLDLGAAPGPVPALQVELLVAALTALVATKKITLTLQHSSDNGVGDAFADVPGTGAMVVTGITGNGAPASLFRLYLPCDVKRYVRATATVEAAGGDNTAKTFTLQFAC